MQQKLKDHATCFCSSIAKRSRFVLLVYQAESLCTPVELPVVITGLCEPMHEPLQVHTGSMTGAH
jgi:hypothetical protein